MSDQNLRKAIIRLAHAKPKLRKDLLPLLKKSSGLTHKIVEKYLRHSGNEYSMDRGGNFTLGDLLIYWDDQDFENTGWAYRFKNGESGEIDTIRELESILTNI